MKRAFWRAPHDIDELWARAAEDALQLDERMRTEIAYIIDAQRKDKRAATTDRARRSADIDLPEDFAQRLVDQLDWLLEIVAADAWSVRFFRDQQSSAARAQFVTWCRKKHAALIDLRARLDKVADMPPQTRIATTSLVAARAGLAHASLDFASLLERLARTAADRRSGRPKGGNPERQILIDELAWLWISLGGTPTAGGAFGAVVTYLFREAGGFGQAPRDGQFRAAPRDEELRAGISRARAAFGLKPRQRVEQHTAGARVVLVGSPGAPIPQPLDGSNPQKPPAKIKN